jgi:hypothetical protein
MTAKTTAKTKRIIEYPKHINRPRYKDLAVKLQTEVHELRKQLQQLRALLEQERSNAGSAYTKELEQFILSRCLESMRHHKNGRPR